MIDFDFAAEPAVVCVWWDAVEPRLTVALDVADPAAVKAVGRRLLPALAAQHASLAVGPDYGVRPGARGEVVYTR